LRKENQYQERITSNGNASSAPQILEKQSFLQINNKLNFPSSSSSSSSSFSSFSIFFPLISISLSSFLGIDKIIYLDNNKMNTNDR
jgi:hypothetical protein